MMGPQKTSKNVPAGQDAATGTPAVTPLARPTIRLHVNSAARSSSNTARQALSSLPAVGNANGQASNTNDNNASSSLTKENKPKQQSAVAEVTSGPVNEQQAASSSLSNTPADFFTLLDEHLRSDHVEQLLEFQQNLLSDLSLLQGEFYDEILPQDDPQNVVFYNSELNNAEQLFEFESRLKSLLNRLADSENEEESKGANNNPQNIVADREEYEACCKLSNEKRDQLTALRTYLEGDEGHSYKVSVVYKLIGNQLRTPAARSKPNRSKRKQVVHAPVVDSSHGSAVSGPQRSPLGNLGGDEISSLPSHQRVLLAAPPSAPSLHRTNLSESEPSTAITSTQQISTLTLLPGNAAFATPRQPEPRNPPAKINKSITGKRKPCGAWSSSDRGSDDSQSKRPRKMLKGRGTNGAMRGLGPGQLSTPGGQVSSRAAPYAGDRTSLPPSSAAIANRTPAPRGETRAQLARMNEELQSRIVAMQQHFESETSSSQRLLNHATSLLGRQDGQIADLSARVLTLSNENTQLRAEIDRLQDHPDVASNARPGEREDIVAKEGQDDAKEE